jgi:4-hydroxy-2-oxoheptanedioate aldolase
MNTPANGFRTALGEGRLQIGLWVGLASPYTAEICAGAGFDWLALDAEHAPNTIPTLLAQLQAIAAYPVHAVVRAAHSDPAHIKQLLDIGAESLIVPMVETPEQARDVVRATRYPPEGIRGVGAALARASRWNRRGDYLQRANDEICLLVQAESRTALDNVDAIARTDGIDGVFIGPADLAASMDRRGQPGHPDVLAAIAQAIAAITSAGKIAGILSGDETLAREFIAAGCKVVAVGVDTTLLARATSELAVKFGRGGGTQWPAGSTGY